MTRSDTLARVAATIESRKPALGADPATSYVARLLAKGPDAFLKKIGEEATEVVLAAKDVDHGADKAKLVYEVADLWFHSLVALATTGCTPTTCWPNWSAAKAPAALPKRPHATAPETRIPEEGCAMSDITDVEDQRAEGLKAWGWVSYLLHLIVAVGAVIPGAQPGAALLIIALVIDLVKKSDSDGTWQASHYAWRIRTVIWAGVLYVLTAPLWVLFLLPGWIAWGLISIWFLYRIVRGMVTMNQSRAIDA